MKLDWVSRHEEFRRLQTVYPLTIIIVLNMTASDQLLRGRNVTEEFEGTLVIDESGCVHATTRRKRQTKLTEFFPRRRIMYAETE